MKSIRLVATAASPRWRFASRLGALALGVLACTAPSRGAGLAWLTTVIDEEAPSGRSTVGGQFHFENTSSTPVNILSVSTSCGCTTGVADKPLYAPGESGTVTVLFDLEGRTGAHEAKITVTTDAKPTAHVLTLRVKIYEPVTAEPRVIFWKRGEDNRPKTAQLHLLKGVKPLKVISSNAIFAAVLKNQGDDGHAVTIVPSSTDSAVRATVEIWTSGPGPEDVGPAKYVMSVYIF